MRESPALVMGNPGLRGSQSHARLIARKVPSRNVGFGSLQGHALEELMRAEAEVRGQQC